MSKSDAFENSLLKLIFNAVAIANLADNAASSPLTNIYVSLHTADPGETGTQATNEAAYTGYARIALVRTSGGWTVTANSVSPAAAVNFGACTASPGSPITHMGVGALSAGAGTLFYSGAISPNITMANGVTPQLTTATTITED